MQRSVVSFLQVAPERQSMKRILLSLLLLLMAAATTAQSAPKQEKVDLPKVFDNAQYVYVEAASGDRLSSEVFPGYRQAIYDVEKTVRDWARYSVATTSRDQADLVFIVRKGHAAGASLPVAGIPSRPQPGSQRSPFPNSSPGDDPRGPGVEAQTGSPDDTLTVFTVSSSGNLNGPIRTQTLKHGLNRPNLPLLKQLKHDVETAYPH
jgi:hypothetical protein